MVHNRTVFCRFYFFDGHNDNFSYCSSFSFIGYHVLFCVNLLFVVTTHDKAITFSHLSVNRKQNNCFDIFYLRINYLSFMKIVSYIFIHHFIWDEKMSIFDSSEQTCLITTKKPFKASFSASISCLFRSFVHYWQVSLLVFLVFHSNIFKNAKKRIWERENLTRMSIPYKSGILSSFFQ